MCGRARRGSFVVHGDRGWEVFQAAVGGWGCVGKAVTAKNVHERSTRPDGYDDVLFFFGPL